MFECVAVHGVRNLKVWCMAEIRSVETQLTINTQATSTALPQAPKPIWSIKHRWFSSNKDIAIGKTS